MTILAVVGCVAVLAVALAMRNDRRRDVPRRSGVDRTPAPDDIPAARDPVAARLMRLQHAVDVIAVEVERIGENQRFLTNALIDASENRAVRKEKDPAR